jgi:nucleotide-binding universal stress UspA family protein
VSRGLGTTLNPVYRNAAARERNRTSGIDQLLPSTTPDKTRRSDFLAATQFLSMNPVDNRRPKWEGHQVVNDPGGATAVPSTSLSDKTRRGRPFRTILVLIDGSMRGRAAARIAGDLAQASEGCLVVMGVFERPNNFAGMYVPVESLLRDAEREMEWEVRRVVADLPMDVRVTLRVKCGKASRILLEEATIGGHDLVVIGAGRRRVLSRCSRRLRRSGVSLLVVSSPSGHATPSMRTRFRSMREAGQLAGPNVRSVTHAS